MCAAAPGLMGRVPRRTGTALARRPPRHARPDSDSHRAAHPENHGVAQSSGPAQAVRERKMATPSQGCGPSPLTLQGPATVPTAAATPRVSSRRAGTGPASARAGRRRRGAGSLLALTESVFLSQSEHTDRAAAGRGHSLKSHFLTSPTWIKSSLTPPNPVQTPCQRHGDDTAPSPTWPGGKAVRGGSTSGRPARRSDLGPVELRPVCPACLEPAGQRWPWRV